MLRRLLTAHRQSPGSQASLIMVVAVGLASVGSYVFSLVCIRWLGAESYAEVAALTSLSLLILLPMASFQNALAREVAQRRAAGRDDEIHALLRRSLGRAAVVGAVIAALLALVSPLIADLLGVGSVVTVLLMAATVGISTLTPVTQGGLQGLERFKAFGGSTVLWAMSRPVLAMPLIYVAGVDGAMLTGVVAGVFAVVLMVAALRDVLRRSSAPSVPVSSTLAAPGFMTAVIGTLAITSITNVDVIAAKVELSADDAGIYAAAALVGKCVLFAAAGITTVMLPRVTVRLAHGHSVSSAVKKSLVAVVALGAVITLIVAPLPESLVRAVFGETFGDARDLLAPFAATMTICAVVQVLLIVAIASGDEVFPRVLMALAVGHIALLAAFGHSSEAILAVTAVVAVGAIVTYVGLAVTGRLGRTSGIVEEAPAFVAPDEAPALEHGALRTPRG